MDTSKSQKSTHNQHKPKSNFGTKSETHKPEPYKPESYKPEPKHHKYHKKTITLFGKKIPIKLVGLIIIGIIGIVSVFAMTSSIMRNIKESTPLDYMRLVHEDEELLCSNENYSTRYNNFLPRSEPEDIEEERVEYTKALILSEIESTTKALNYYISHPILGEGDTPEKHKKAIAELQDYLNNFNKRLERIEAGDFREFYRHADYFDKDIFNYTINYVSEIDNEPVVVLPSPLPAIAPNYRRSMITLDNESYAKWSEKIKNPELRQEAIEDIKDLKCLESITFPQSSQILDREGKPIMDRILNSHIYEHYRVDPYTDHIISTWTGTLMNYSPSTGWTASFGGQVDLAPLTKFVNLKILDLRGFGIETKYKNRASKFTFKNMPNLKILKLGGIDRTCKKVKPVRKLTDYYYDSGGNIPNYTPPCSPDEYYNETESVRTIRKPEYPNSSTRPVERTDYIYAKCGSNIFALKELKHLRRLEAPNVLWGLDVLQYLDSLKYLAINTLGPIDLSGYSMKPKIGVIKKIEEPDNRQPRQLKEETTLEDIDNTIDQQPDQLGEETIPKGVDDTMSSYDRLLALNPAKYLPDLEYLNIEGEIYNPSFGFLKNLSELHIIVTQNDKEVDFEYLKTMPQLEKVEISAPLPSGFCSSLETSLADADVVCKEWALKDVPDPYPGISVTVHRVVDCPEEEDEDDENDEGDEDDENGGFKGQKEDEEEEEEKKTMVINYTTTYTNGAIKVSWDVTGNCPHFNDPGKEQEALDIRYDEETELFLEDVRMAHPESAYKLTEVERTTWIPCTVIEYDPDRSFLDIVIDGVEDFFSYSSDYKGEDYTLSRPETGKDAHWGCGTGIFDGQCIRVKGGGSDTCSTNADCGGKGNIIDGVPGKEESYIIDLRVHTYYRWVPFGEKVMTEYWIYKPAAFWPKKISTGLRSVPPATPLGISSLPGPGGGYDYYNYPSYTFNGHYNAAALKDRHGSKAIAICDVERFDQSMWRWERGFFENTFFQNLSGLFSGVIEEYYEQNPEDSELQPVEPGSADENESWVEITFNSLGLTFRIPYSRHNYHAGYLGLPGIFANISMGPVVLGSISEYALEQKLSGGEKPLPDFKKIKGESWEGFKDLPSPILISPSDGAVVSRNEPVTFTWEMPKGTDLSNLVYTWHVTVDGELPPWGASYGVSGINTGGKPSFTYMPSNPADSSIKTAEDGTWEWKVLATIPGEGQSRSETRTLTWRDEEDDEKDLDIDLTPILLSPNNRFEVSVDEPVVFTWQLPDNTVLPPGAKYYWHVTINRQGSHWYEKQWSIDVGSRTSFIMSDLYQLRTGTWDPEIWEWNIVVVVPGKESYWSRARTLILQKDKKDEEKDDLPDDKDFTPILLSPGKGVVVSKNEPVTFTWEMPEAVDLSGITYFWDVTIDGGSAPWGTPGYGMNTRNNASFTYTPSDTFESLTKDGTSWEWRVIAFILGEGVYSSKTRTLIWQDEDDDNDTDDDLTPKLLSPDNGVVIPIDKSIVFTWKLLDDAVLPLGARYYWHVEINNIKRPFIPGDQYNIDVGSNASFTYSPDAYSLEIGTWEWSVVTFVPGKENYWSETRKLIREGSSS